MRRHTVWVGAVVAFVPLALLLNLQYGWLVRLEKTSAIAHEATLDNYLESLATEFEYWFKTNAERVLNLPSSHFTEDALARSAYHFRKKGVQGAKRLFVVTYAGEYRDQEKLYVFDPVTWEKPPLPSEVKAVLVALAPWKVMAQRELTLATEALSVDERDKDNRMILNPVTDERSRVVGVAGMILDNDYVKDVLIPSVVKKSLSHASSAGLSGELMVTVRDQWNSLIAGDSLPEEVDETRRGFDFIYTDWSLGLHSTHLTAEQWARSNFVLNLTLSALLAIFLIGGIVLALGTVSREMRLSQMKTDFVSNVSHELRTPLSSIRVFGEFLRLGMVKNPEKRQEYGEFIETESRRLTQLINNILDFSKIESGGKTYRFEPADMKTVISEALRTFEVRLQHGGITVDLEMPDGPLPAVKMDHAAMIQAISNLLDNAVKYSSDSKRIAVRLFRKGRFLVVAITDHGIGISRDEREKIFERFHRVHTGLVHDVKGSGLGLAIVNHIVSAHGGKITVDSEPEKGSTFSIHVPVDDRVGSAPAAITSSGSVDAGSHA